MDYTDLSVYLCLSVVFVLLLVVFFPPVSLQYLVLLPLPGLLSVWRIKSLDAVLAIRGLIPEPGLSLLHTSSLPTLTPDCV